MALLDLNIIQWYTSSADLLYAGTCLMVMVACVVCAAFRWFHMCKPYDQSPAQYYPARKLVTVFFLCQLLNIPFLLRPSFYASVSYASCVELLILSSFITSVFNTFFKRNVPYQRLITALLIWLPISITAILGIGLIFYPNSTAPLITKYLPFVVGAVSLILGLHILKIMLWLVRQIDGYHKAEFSNEADFPYTFAKKLVWLPWIVLALCWLAMVNCSMGLLICIWIFLAIFSVYYTIIIMSPQVGSPILCIEQNDNEDAGVDVPLTDESESTREAIRKRVIEIAQSRYLEPHLTRRDVTGMFDYGERTIAGEIITSYGFYDMINTLRLEHARRYKQLHPEETKESIAINSGFKDRYAMRYGERHISSTIPEILDGFEPLIK